MVSSASFVFMGFTLLMSIGLPIGLAIYLCVKRKASPLAVLVGALVFVVTQVLIRIPLLQLSSQMAWYQAMAANLVVIALFLSLTAGLFEETGRYLAFRFLLKNKLQTKNALAFGVGHGGIEAILLVGLSFINNFAFSMMINAGTFDQVVAPALGASAETLKSQLVGLAPESFAVAGVERTLTILAHIGMSLLVYYAVRYGKVRFYFLALLAHTLINFGVVMIAQLNNGIWLSELYLLVWAVGALVLIFRSEQVEAWLARPAADSAPLPVLPPD
jgi:uncharacterized membrane protein YhfC